MCLGCQLITERGRAYHLDLPAGTPCLVLKGVYWRALLAEENFCREKGLGRIIAQQPHIDLTTVNILFDQHRLPESIKDFIRSLPQIPFVVYYFDPKGHRLIFWLYDQGICDIRHSKTGCVQHFKVRCGQAVLAEDHFRHHFVQRE